MKPTLLLLAAALGLLGYAECIIILGAGTAAAGTGTVTTATAANAAALAGVGGLVIGAGLVGVLALAASRRGKRSVQDVMKEEAVFNLVSASDSLGCALKLVCLLEGKPEEQLSDDDKFILTIFGREPEAPSIEKLQAARGAYDYAAFMGSKFGADACEKLFHTCNVAYEDMIAYVARLRA